MNQSSVVAMLARSVHAAGSLRAWGAENSIDHTWVFRVLTGEKPPAGKILDALGVEVVITYRRKRR
jgi:hypothetical protein